MDKIKIECQRNYARDSPPYQHDLIAAKLGTLARLRLHQQIATEITERKKIISSAGILGTSFTKTVIKANRKVAIAMYQRPRVVSVMKNYPEPKRKAD